MSALKQIEKIVDRLYARQDASTWTHHCCHTLCWCVGPDVPVHERTSSEASHALPLCRLWSSAVPRTG